MNIALFGGSFDPPHIAHEKIIKKSIDLLDIDKLIIMPTYLNPFKQQFHLKPQVRLSYMNILCQNIDKAVVDEFEVKSKRKVPTIETVEYLYDRYNIDKLYLIIGADNLSTLKLWDDYDRLNQLVEFIVASRDGIKSKNYKTIKIDIPTSSTKLREHMDIDMIPQKLKHLFKTDIVL